MSLKVKCFATVIESGSHPGISAQEEFESDGHIEIHSTLYELFPKDFLAIIFNIEKDVLRYSATVMIGEEDSREILWTSSPIFTNYASKEKNNCPVPLLNQPISQTENEQSGFKSTRFWAFKNYFFVTNRHYSKSELYEVKMKIHHLVKKFDDELEMISMELKSIGVNYKNQIKS